VRNFPRNKYSVSTRRHGIEWEWEIVRNDQPLGARVRGGPHKFEAGAFKEGTAALNEFLVFLKRERSAR
jgi:hypothetical protein